MIFRILIVLMMISNYAKAENNLQEEVKENAKANPVATFFLMEGLAAVNSWMASENPQVYGGAGVLLFPLANECKGISKTGCWVNLGTIESLAIYNLSIDPDKTSKAKIFRNNMIGWHLLAGAIALNYQIFKTENKKLSISPLPKEGIAITYYQRF